ncbi:hypothetical protein [Cellulomonas sp. RIT-PI-Y]|uniref:hypothetical protein n=1 Tax=Cellulomonas sp. RIT-PI-Y TaxID=3035297 RepID=UPI0021DAB3A4|nr:hypothetical protein [Cellulomonas sp. RIT-PI-Y]
MATTLTPRLAAVVEDCEFMAQHGETLTGAAHRLGYATRDSLERTLWRANRYDLVTRLKAPEVEEARAEAGRRIQSRHTFGA